MEKTCLICNNIYIKKPSESMKYWSEKSTCSKKCGYILISRKMKGKSPKNITSLAGWNRGKPAIWATNEKSKNWKGDKAGNTAIHDWIKRRFGFPNVCEKCGLKSDNHYRIHWANATGEYKRERTDWIRLCVKCHKNYDNRRRKKRIWKNQFGCGTF